MAAKAGVANRPRIPNDPPCLYRIFCVTSQRVPCELSQLNSAAAYLFISDDDERVIVWAGEFATDSDFDLSQELALEVIRRDMRKFDATDVDDVIYEGEEKQVQELFEYFLDKLWTDERYNTSFPFFVHLLNTLLNTIPVFNMLQHILLTLCFCLLFFIRQCLSWQACGGGTTIQNRYKHPSLLLHTY